MKSFNEWRQDESWAGRALGKAAAYVGAAGLGGLATKAGIGMATVADPGGGAMLPGLMAGGLVGLAGAANWLSGAVEKVENGFYNLFKKKNSSNPAYLKPAEMGLNTSPDVPKFQSVLKQLQTRMPFLEKYKNLEDPKQATAFRLWVMRNQSFKDVKAVDEISALVDEGLALAQKIGFKEAVPSLQKISQTLASFKDMLTKTASKASPSTDIEVDQPVKKDPHEASLNKSKIELAILQGLNRNKPDEEILGTLAGLGLSPSAAKSWLTKGKKLRQGQNYPGRE